MKKLFLITAFLFSINAQAQTTCPSDTSVRWHNCVGTYTFASGNQYVGAWKDDKKHGQGTFTYANGDQYVGEYKDNKMHGQGTYTYEDGTTERGYHMNDEYVPTICENMGLTKGTESFGNCVVELIKQINEGE